MSGAVAGIFDNGVLWWGLAACGVAQLSKLLVELVVHRRWNPRVLVETGGMPSSHAALMTGTSAALGWMQGFQDPLFGLAAVLAFIVLYDASGVRRAAGLTAQRVNGLPDGLWQTAPETEPLLRPLKENLGHTRLEVLAGSLIGPLVALPGLVWLGSPLNLAQRFGLLPG
ncbi:MAG: divergent PAP2 family protein [Cyanobacteriota bacterium]|nr:divergent PAP2 family protein [Cyanobacteriota bacterium]